MNKRIFVTMASVALSFATATAFADSLVLEKPQINGDNIQIIGTTPMGKEEIVVTVTKKGETAANKKAVYFSKQTLSDTDGDFSFGFTMNPTDRMTGEEFMGGEFTIYARSTNSELVTDDFVFVSASGKKTALGLINKKRGDKYKLYDFVTAGANSLVLKSLGTPLDEFTALSNEEIQLKVCGILAKSETDFDETSWGTSFEDALMAMEINKISDISGIESFLQKTEVKEKLTLEHEGVKYSEASADIKNLFYNMVLSAAASDSFESMAELDEKYAQSVVLDKINKTNYTLIFDEIIEPNKKVLGLSESESFIYIQSLGSNADDVIKLLKESGTDFTTAEGLSSALDAAAEAYKASLNVNTGSITSSNKNTNSNGSSSGGGSKFSVVQNPVGTSPETKKDESGVNSDSKVWFNDTSSAAWAEEAINALAGAGIVSGNGDGSFEPSRLVTRAEYIKMLIAALDLIEDNAECDFDDVQRSDWFYPYVATAKTIGITDGISENLFGPNEFITREQMAVFAHRAANRAFLPVTGTASEELFADDEKISEWAKRSVYLMRGSGIINGTDGNMFMPDSGATRAEAAKVIYELYKLG